VQGVKKSLGTYDSRREGKKKGVEIEVPKGDEGSDCLRQIATVTPARTFFDSSVLSK
jgi:hypothetical protein